MSFRVCSSTIHLCNIPYTSMKSLKIFYLTPFYTDVLMRFSSLTVQVFKFRCMIFCEFLNILICLYICVYIHFVYIYIFEIFQHIFEIRVPGIICVNNFSPTHDKFRAIRLRFKTIKPQRVRKWKSFTLASKHYVFKKKNSSKISWKQRRK